MNDTPMRHGPARQPGSSWLGWWPWWYLLAAVALTGPAVPSARAQETQDALSGEYPIKAAFLCKFGNYIEWLPAAFAGPDAPFVIGVLAPMAVADEVVAAANGLLVQGRPIVVRRVAPSDSLDGLHILFIARGQAGLLAALAAVKDRPILTVTESGSEAGAIVNFVVVNNKVRFDVSLPAAERSGLKVSARLLGVARHVAGRPPS